jgi:iron complex outermembrane receptor protein
MHRRFLKFTWSTVSVIALAATSFPAVAAETDSSVSPQTGQPAAASSDAGDPSDSGEEIVVTALKGDQSLQRAAAVVTVVDGEQLERAGITDVRGLQQVVPAARIVAANTATKITMRGVGSLLDFYWIPEAVAMNFNGVYVPRFATSGAFYDIESVQALPGPQGVLYGRSAGGGALLINANRPTDELSFKGQIEAGNYDLVSVTGAVNLPVSEQLAFRAAFSRTKRDGYQSLNLMEDDSWSFRLSSLLNISDNVSAYFWVTRYDQTGNPTAANYIPEPAGQDFWFIPENDPYSGLSNRGAFTDFQYTMAGGELAAEVGEVNVLYRTSFLSQTETALRKLVGNNQVVDTAQKQYTHNVQADGSVGLVDFIVGADYFLARSRHDVRFGPNQFGQIFPLVRQESASVFGQLTANVSDTFRVVGGARYSRDKLRIRGTNNACFFGNCLRPPVTFDGSWEHLDWKVGVEADAASHAMLYANVQTGYIPGTLNTYANTVVFSKEILPQKLLAYTAGVKSRLADGAMTLNLEGFYYDYKDLIVQSFNAALGQQSLFNVPKTTIWGAQLQGNFKPSRNDTLAFNVAYTRGRYGSFQATPTSPQVQGLQTSFTPTWTATLSYDRRFDFASAAHLDFRAATYITSSYWGPFDHTAMARQEAYHKSDASLTFYPASERFSIGVWVRNLENTEVRGALTPSGLAPPAAPGTFFPEAPRTYGISLGVDF